MVMSVDNDSSLNCSPAFIIITVIPSQGTESPDPKQIWERPSKGLFTLRVQHVIIYPVLLRKSFSAITPKVKNIGCSGFISSDFIWITTAWSQLFWPNSSKSYSRRLKKCLLSRGVLWYNALAGNHRNRQACSMLLNLTTSVTGNKSHALEDCGSDTMHYWLKRNTRAYTAKVEGFNMW